MVVEILFCPTCSGYHPRAVTLADELSESLGVVAKVTAGGRGQFDVLVDGVLVFSKRTKRRFPDEGEVTRLMT